MWQSRHGGVTSSNSECTREPWQATHLSFGVAANDT
jgi:hypothetical protein